MRAHAVVDVTLHVFDTFEGHPAGAITEFDPGQLYLPTTRCLEYFEPRLSPGAVVVLDDYSAKRCEGVRDAVDEYLAQSRAFQAWDLRTEQLMLVRR